MRSGPPCPRGCGPMDQCETDWALCRSCRFSCFTDGPDEGPDDMSPVTDLPMETPGQRVMYAILDREARVYGSGKSAGTLYKTKSAAVNKATRDGDTVIAVVINLRAEPLYIRRRSL